MNEKQMKKYISAVGRRLNLPGSIKKQVLADFILAVQERRESGKTEREIYAELGDARHAAADLNRRMEEYTYRKSPLRFLFAALGLYGGGKLLAGAVFPLVAKLMLVRTARVTAESISVGIIGGADGPTSVLVAYPQDGSVWWSAALFLIVGVAGYYLLSRMKHGNT